jgi:hypothetical protein
MKLWQLVSIMPDDTPLLQSIASSQENWKQFVIWFEDFGRLVEVQDRSKLDYVLPDGLVRLALARSEKVCFLSKDGWLRSWRMSPDDELLSALEVYQRYGGDVLEDVFEKGVVGVF